MKNRKNYYLLAFVLIGFWLVVAGFGGPTFGKISGLSNNAESSFLPKTAQSTLVENQIGNFSQSNTLPAILLFTSQKAIKSSVNNAYLTGLIPKLSLVPDLAISKTSAVVGPIYSADGFAAEIFVPIKAVADNTPSINAISKIINTNKPVGLISYVTGPAGIVNAFSTAFNGINGILTYVAIISVLVILLLVYRSLLLPFLVLISAIFALSGSILVVFALASHNIVSLNGESQGILSILVIGATTDYSILILSRFKEKLHEFESKVEAVKQTLFASWEPVLAAASTVVAALLGLLFSSLNSNRSLGPIAAIGIIVSFLVAMSFFPSLLLIFGRKAFWPLKVKYQPDLVKKENLSSYNVYSRFWSKVALFVEKKYRLIWISLTVVLLALIVLALPTFKASGVTQTETIMGNPEAVQGQNLVGKYFPAGSGNPVEIIARQTSAAQIISELSKNSAVSSSLVVSSFNPLTKKATPIVYNGKVLIQTTINYQAQSTPAQNFIKSIRSSLKQYDPNVLVGGNTAIQLDVNTAASRDLHVIIPIVLTVILVILMLLLRSILAPIVLILSVVLSFASTLAISALFFNHVFNFPGSDPSVPLFGFIFLVALGVDYNIFLMTRIREESIRHSTRFGILKGLSMTGSVITSAGIVLAATFAALGVIPILFLAEIAFIVAFGVLLDTLIIRSLLVTSISYDLDKKIWWPNQKKFK